LTRPLRELENEGLVTSQSNRGIFVSRLDEKEARAIFDVRASLESLICRLFCENATEAQMAECRVCFKDLEKAYAQGRPDEVIKAKSYFYDVLMAGADNEIAERMLRSIHIRVSQLRTMSLSDSARRAASLVELRTLYDSLMARDAAATEQHSKTHIWAAAQAAMAKLP